MKSFIQENTRLLLAGTHGTPRWNHLFELLFEGKLASGEMKSLLLLSTKRGLNPNMIWNCLKTMRALERPRAIRIPSLMDVCGTGGDRAQTFNISTVSSFVIAGAGGRVAKHGNRAVSSRVGSSDLMEALGVRVNVSMKRMTRSLLKYGLGYFHAPLYHPSFAVVSPIRRELGVRTFFNLLGPLTNPLKIDYQMVGVSRLEWMGPVAEILRRLERKRAAVLRSVGGLDELASYEPNDILLIERGRLKRFRLNPREYGFSQGRRSDYKGGGLATNKKIALGILEGRLEGPVQEAVLLNSGFALWLSGQTGSIQEGIVKSRWALRTGKALEVLEGLKKSAQASAL